MYNSSQEFNPALEAPESQLQQMANFAISFQIFEKNNEQYFMRIVCWQTILMKYRTLFVIFVKAAKFEIVVCCKL